jgi:creatinine amidohydrolase
VAKEQHGVVVTFPDITRKPWAVRLTAEFKSGACHAGQFETSIVMAERPDLVRESIRVTLDPNPTSLSQAIREGKKTFEEAGGPSAYFGFPRGASAAEGRDDCDAGRDRGRCPGGRSNTGQGRMRHEIHR